MEEKLECAECGNLSISVEAAQEHAKLFSHMNFFLSDEQIVDFSCCSCSTSFNSFRAMKLHKKQSGHFEYEDLEAKRIREADERVEAIRAALAKEREKQIMLQTRLIVRQTQMSLCLASIKQKLKFANQEERALNTLMTIVRNVAKNPDEEKFRRVRVSSVEERIGYVDAGLKFLELCKFENLEGGVFLFLPRYEVELELLATAESELEKALSKEENEKSMF